MAIRPKQENHHPKNTLQPTHRVIAKSNMIKQRDKHKKIGSLWF